jgi:hypothetical protein
MLILLFTHEIETNYCSDGGHFELLLPISSFTPRVSIPPQHGESLINSELNQSIPIQIYSQLPEGTEISFGNYDSLTINTACEVYTDNGQMIFKDDESKIIARNQVVLWKHGKNIEMVFCRKIMITIIRSNNRYSINKFLIVAALKKENGQLIEISSVETNSDVVKIYGKVKTTISGTASTVHNDISITSLSPEYLLHDNEQRYYGKYIIISENNDVKN